MNSAFSLSLAGFVSMIALVGYAWRSVQLRKSVRDRLFSDLPHTAPPAARNRLVPTLLPRHRWIAWIVGLITTGVLSLLGVSMLLAATAGLVVALLSSQLESYWTQQRAARVEAQLADAIDLMIGALGAGAGATAAMEIVLVEISRPLASAFEEMIGRIRLGDSPRAVFSDLSVRVPLETFLLFSSTMAVHWEVGGSLAPTLANVGRTIRERIETARKIRSNIVQSQLSTMIVVAVTYFVALLMWRNDPDNFRQFLASDVGRWLIAGSMLLQAVGMAWMSAMSRLKF